MKKAQMSYSMKILISLVMIVVLIILGIVIWKKGILGILGGA